MKITPTWLKENDACVEGQSWFNTQSETDGIKVLHALIKDEKLDWANWTATRLMTHKQRIQYAIFAAEQVIGIYEKQYPDDKRPRQAIDAARAVLKNNNAKTRFAARSAAWSAESAAWSATGSAEFAAWSAESAARSAAWSAWSAARSTTWSARSAAWSARSAARSTTWSARSATWSVEFAVRSTTWSAEEEMKTRIIVHGIKILSGKVK